MMVITIVRRRRVETKLILNGQAIKLKDGLMKASWMTGKASIVIEEMTLKVIVKAL